MLSLQSHTAPSGKVTFLEKGPFLDQIDELMQDTKYKSILDSIKNSVGPWQLWPAHQLQNLLSKHLVRHGRFDLTKFILANRCPPNEYANWLLLRGSLWDKSARDHVADLIKQYTDGRLEKHTTWHLPHMVTVDSVPRAERKHPWDGVGNPPMSTSECVQHIATPSRATLAEFAWMYTKAVSALTGSQWAPFVGVVEERKFEIVPYAHKDYFSDEDPMDTEETAPPPKKPRVA